MTDVSDAEVLDELVGRNRVAVITLDHQTLEQLLELPEGYSVVAVHGDYTTRSIKLQVHSHSLAPVHPGTALPELGGVGSSSMLVTEDGVPFFRWAWSRTNKVTS